ncbi:three-Cys-motif partner protein TcmP [Saccharopolyspora sp. 5N102]|uniref:three-Cys-motif partner protein TcmP n=1 Tax=Saccharopolyspora sp. 5N102 TaxID=3375155 RepID=UPI0037B5D659
MIDSYPVGGRTPGSASANVIYQTGAVPEGEELVTANDEFFQKKQAAAVLKHGILKRYPTVFSTMTGSTSQQGRVVYLDGYAGPGRYEPEGNETEGAPGSPLLAMQTADRVASWQRAVDCIFIERNRKYAENLKALLRAEAPPSLSYQVMAGDVADRLDEALAIAGDSPLLAFLDPFGTALPYVDLVQKLLRRGRDEPTEVLLNLNLEMVWRVGGLLTEDGIEQEKSSGNAATLARLDDFLGDQWWRATFRAARDSTKPGAAARAAREVADTFCRRVFQDTGYSSFPVEIRRRPGHNPLFLLILFYRHPAAPFKFAEAASKANEEWRHYHRRLDLAEELERLRNGETLGLFDDNDLTALSDQEAKSIEKQLEQDWVVAIVENIRRLVSEKPAVDIGDHVTPIYGTTLGLARPMHIRRAWDALADEAVVRPRVRSKDLRTQTIYRR